MTFSASDSSAPVLSPAFDTVAFREAFPFYRQAHQLQQTGAQAPVYLDAAATSQRPDAVLDAEYRFAAFKNAAVHRGTSAATGAATDAFESARERVASFLGCGSSHTLVWQSGATDALNTLAFAFSEATVAAATAAPAEKSRFALQTSSEIVITVAEHHANLVPWQRLAARTGARLVVLPVTPTGVWELNELAERLSSRTRIVAFTHLSNVTGWCAPVPEAVALVRKHAPQAVTVLDACQAVAHLEFNVSDLDVDFAVFSGHKMYAPNGVGGILGRTELLAQLPPARTGGSAITFVTPTSAEFLPPPQRFEPGTQPVSQVVGMGAAVDFLCSWQMRRICQAEHELSILLHEKLKSLPGVQIIGPAEGRTGLVAFTLAGIHPHDAGQILDTLGITVRVGHHCAQPLHRALGINSSVRASVSAATTVDELDTLVAGIQEAQKYFGEK